MRIFRKFSLCITALLFAISLFSCQAELHKEAEFPSPPFDRSTYAIEKIRETHSPEDYPVLTNAKEYLNYDIEIKTLHLYVWRIESFDFLSEFDNIKSLIVTECYIPEGVTIPDTEALNDVIEIQMNNIYGSGAADALSDCLPIPKLDRLYLSGAENNNLPLPAIPSLTDLYISVPDALNIIGNNTHITGALGFGDPYVQVHEDIVSINGIEKFDFIQYLQLPPGVYDISPVSGCSNLKILDASQSMAIASMKPLYGLKHLQEINIAKTVYNSLPQEEREHFNQENNSDVDAVHVYTEIPQYHNLDEQEFLELSGQVIESFDFLRDYPNLKRLTVISCDIVDGLVLPQIDSLQYLTVFDSNALELIKNNTQLAGTLEIGSGYTLRDEYEREGLTQLSNLAGLETFSSLEILIVGDPVNDISALSGCVNLRWLDLFYCTSINTLKPLYALSRLRMLIIGPAALDASSAEDQVWLSNIKPYMTAVEWR